MCLTWLCDVPAGSCHPSIDLLNQLCFCAFPIDGKSARCFLTQPFDYHGISVCRRGLENIGPNSFAQLRTRLLGHAIMHFSMVGFPARGDCFKSVNMSAIHCSVLPRPISSAMIDLKCEKVRLRNSVQNQ